MYTKLKKNIKTRRFALVLAVTAGLVVSGCAATGENNAPEVRMDTAIDSYRGATTTVGADGEESTPISELSLTAEERDTLRNGEHRAAILWHTLDAWSIAIQGGMEAMFDELGIEVVATTDAKFDSKTQADQILSSLALQPDVILGQPVDPAGNAAAYQYAVDAGVKLIFAEQAPVGYVHGNEYQSIIGDDIYEIGLNTGEAMCKAIENKGEVGVVFYDADFYTTNFRDGIFLDTLAEKCPDATVVAKEGFSDPNKAEEIAAAMMLRHPEMAGIYVSWATPAQGVLGALRNIGNTTTKIVTIDLDDTLATDMASGGNVGAIIVDSAYEYGKAMAMAAGYAMLGKPAPELGVVGNVQVTKENIADGYKAWNQDVPSAVKAALEKNK